MSDRQTPYGFEWGPMDVRCWPTGGDGPMSPDRAVTPPVAEVLVSALVECIQEVAA